MINGYRRVVDAPARSTDFYVLNRNTDRKWDFHSCAQKMLNELTLLYCMHAIDNDDKHVTRKKITIVYLMMFKGKY